MKTFYQILANSLISGVVNFTVWFAIIFFAYLQTHSVLVTSIISGIYLFTVAGTGFWLGSIVDHHKKKNVMIFSSVISMVIYLIGFIVYVWAGDDAYTSISSPILWGTIILLMAGVLAGNLRNIALPTLVTIMVPEENRAKANGLVGTVSGVGFLITSVISGLLVGHSGMFLVLLLGVIFMAISIVHLYLLPVDEKGIVHASEEGEDAQAAAADKKLDIKGTLKIIGSIPGMFALIGFTTINNFLGGVFMSLMDAYGLSLVSVEVWGLLWGVLSCGFIVGGLAIAKFGLGKNPLSTMFMANIVIWVVSCFFTLQPSIILLMVGMFIYLSVAPFIEAAEHTVIQKLVPPARQGRVFGFAQSVEQAASPLTAFAIGPITQFIFIPFMTTGQGVDLIGDWFGTGEARGIALVFTLTGLIGLVVTVIARNTTFYKQLSKRYLQS